MMPSESRKRRNLARHQEYMRKVLLRKEQQSEQQNEQQSEQPPGSETKPPGSETKPPGSETKPPGSETKPPGSETKPPGSETKPPGSETKPPTSKNTVAAKPPASKGRKRLTPRQAAAQVARLATLLSSDKEIRLAVAKVARRTAAEVARQTASEVARWAAAKVWPPIDLKCYFKTSLKPAKARSIKVGGCGSSPPVVMVNHCYSAAEGGDPPYMPKDNPNAGEHGEDYVEGPQLRDYNNAHGPDTMPYRRAGRRNKDDGQVRDRLAGKQDGDVWPVRDRLAGRWDEDDWIIRDRWDEDDWLVRDQLAGRQDEDDWVIRDRWDEDDWLVRDQLAGRRDEDDGPVRDRQPFQSRSGDSRDERSRYLDGSRHGDRLPDCSRRGDRPPDGPRRRDRTPEGPRRGDRIPDGPRRGDKAPDGSRHGDESLDGSRRGDKAPDGSRRGDKAPDGSRRRDKASDGSRRGDKAPDGSRRGDKASDGSRRMDRPLDGPRMRSNRSDDRYLVERPRSSSGRYRSRSSWSGHSGRHNSNVDPARSMPVEPAIKNMYQNDGSFLDMFKKMQDAQDPKPEGSSATNPSEMDGVSRSKDPSSAIMLKKPTSLVVKRRGGRVLPIGKVKKLKKDKDEEVPTTAFSIYMAEVRKYKETSCDEEIRTSLLVK